MASRSARYGGRRADASVVKDLQIVDAAMEWPSRTGSPWMRRCPQVGFHWRCGSRAGGSRRLWPAVRAPAAGVVPLAGGEAAVPGEYVARVQSCNNFTGNTFRFAWYLGLQQLCSSQVRRHFHLLHAGSSVNLLVDPG